VVFGIAEDTVAGILHAADVAADVGIVIATGGPQYRIGSHRQFVRMGRVFASAGFDAFRFDFRGMGDGDGQRRSFDELDVELQSAIDELQRLRPAVTRIMIVGLCDGATAALLYAPKDARVRAVGLINPWARSEQSLARTTLRSYYLQRLLAPEFWRKLFRGEVAIAGGLREITEVAATTRNSAVTPGFLDRLDHAARGYTGSIVLVLSGNDLTAAEFLEWVNGSPGRARAFSRDGAKKIEIEGANHTLSSRPWFERMMVSLVDGAQSVSSLAVRRSGRA
jgi:exosortase A-associated hydrolase 1